jgi:hypothetical protein
VAESCESSDEPLGFSAMELVRRFFPFIHSSSLNFIIAKTSTEC